MRTLLQLFTIGVISASAGALTYWVKRPPQVPPLVVECDPTRLAADQICLADALELDPTTTLWIDARLRSEWQLNGYEGSVLWNMDPAEDQAAMQGEVAVRLLDGPTVIVYCASESCGTSREIAKQVTELTLAREVRVLYGGWDALAAAGLVPTT